MGQKPLEQGPIGDRAALILRGIAQTQGIPNDQIASETGLSESTISRTFNLKRVMTLPELESISKALGLLAWKVVREAEEAAVVQLADERLEQVMEIPYAATKTMPAPDSQEDLRQR